MQRSFLSLHCLVLTATGFQSHPAAHGLFSSSQSSLDPHPHYSPQRRRHPQHKAISNSRIGKHPVLNHPSQQSLHDANGVRNNHIENGVVVCRDHAPKKNSPIHQFFPSRRNTTDVSNMSLVPCDLSSCCSCPSCASKVLPQRDCGDNASSSLYNAGVGTTSRGATRSAINMDSRDRAHGSSATIMTTHTQPRQSSPLESSVVEPSVAEWQGVPPNEQPDVFSFAGSIGGEWPWTFTPTVQQRPLSETTAMGPVGVTRGRLYRGAPTASSSSADAYNNDNLTVSNVSDYDNNNLWRSIEEQRMHAPASQGQERHQRGNVDTARFQPYSADYHNNQRVTERPRQSRTHSHHSDHYNHHHYDYQYQSNPNPYALLGQPSQQPAVMGVAESTNTSMTSTSPSSLSTPLQQHPHDALLSPTSPSLFEQPAPPLPLSVSHEYPGTEYSVAAPASSRPTSTTEDSNVNSLSHSAP